jgi:hypothetical protein
VCWEILNVDWGIKKSSNQANQGSDSVETITIPAQQSQIKNLKSKMPQGWYNTPMEYWELSDEELLQQCDWYAGRASGPGGQKRNKTHSAINMIHSPTKITVIANEHRMQGENRHLALKRLRLQLALALRREVDLETFQIPDEVTSQINGKGKLAVNPENHKYLPIIAAMLDLLAIYRGQVSKAADLLGISTTNFINILHGNPKLWTTAQELRKRYGLPPLKA